MKIQVNDWNVFEKENHIRFTRDINIDNVIDCFGIACKKNVIYYMAIVDFYVYKTIMFIKSSKNIELIDNSFYERVSYVENKTYCFYDEEDKETIKSHYNWVIANKWIVEHDSFLSMMVYNPSLALMTYYDNN